MSGGDGLRGWFQTLCLLPRPANSIVTFGPSTWSRRYSGCGGSLPAEGFADYRKESTPKFRCWRMRSGGTFRGRYGCYGMRLSLSASNLQHGGVQGVQLGQHLLLKLRCVMRNVDSHFFPRCVEEEEPNQDASR